MLHKSFKPAKCKTSLKLATSRIKLMRNKKGVQINQMKRDLAQLLETGQDRTARIRVEHVIREEKTIAAYDLIEIYCELIVARMPIIESQKTCPIDLKEAVTSVIFAAPRCSDISELADIKKQFTAKFGKEFVSAALELRPESGVSRMLVEKLSAVAPDIQTKVKVLTGVAKDHNINWEPTSFEEKESNPQNDLLASQSFQMGPTEHASVANANANANPGLTKIQPSNINHEKNTGPPLDFAQQNKKYVVDNNAVGTSSSSVSERKEEGQNWNMGFKDATSAAEAAAESAERAAMAARAAAQFASHEKIPGRDEKASHIRDSYERKPKINYQQMDQSEHEQKDNNTRSNKSNTFKESKPELQSGKKESFSGNRNPKVINQEMDRYEHEQKDTERFHEAKSKSSKLNSFVESKTELESGTKGSFGSENVNFFAEEASRKQARDHSSSSGYEFNDEVVSNDKKIGKRSAVGNPFAVVDERNIFSESRKSKSDVVDQIDDEATFDDDYVDDDGGPKFDTGFEYDEFGESSTHSLENAHIWSPRKKESIKIEKTSSSQSHLFSENLSFGKHSVKSSETEDRVPASFDHSDSDNESEFTGNNNNSNDIPEPSITKSRIELNDLVEEERESSYHDRENEEKKKRESEEKSYDRFEDNNESWNPSNEVELNFGKLTGGLRHKAAVLKYPPYTKPLAKTDAMDSPNKSINESSMIVDEIIPDSKASKKTSVSKSNHESDLDDHSDKFQVPSSNPRSQFSPPTPFFDDDDDDEDNDVLKQTSSSVRLRSELSRRTRGSPSISRSKIHVNPNPKPVTSSSINSRYSYSDEITADPPSIVRKTEGNKKTTEAKIQMPVRKSEESGKTMENLGSVDNLVKKPSYVHPKLPDYDTFAARLQSLRDERK